jgi:hypothetical protein
MNPKGFSDSVKGFTKSPLMKVFQSYEIMIFSWMQLLEKTEQGKRILKRFTELKQTFEKANNYLDLDKLKEKGQTLFKELVE